MLNVIDEDRKLLRDRFIGIKLDSYVDQAAFQLLNELAQS